MRKLRKRIRKFNWDDGAYRTNELLYTAEMFRNHAEAKGLLYNMVSG